MPKGTVRITFRLPYDTANAEHYDGSLDSEPTNHEELLVAMAKFDVDNFPELLSEREATSIEFDGWSE